MLFFSAIGVATCVVLGLFVVIFVLFILRADADLTLLLAEKVGKKPGVLKGKVVWITGASSGIGEQLAYLLAACGCKLVISGPTSADLESVKRQCLAKRSLSSEEVLGLPFDISDCSVQDECIKTVLDHFGQATGLYEIGVMCSSRMNRNLLSSQTDLSVERGWYQVANIFCCHSMSWILLRWPHQPPHLKKQNYDGSQIDILVNNAGRSQRAEFQNIKEEVDHALFAVNVFGPVNLTRKVVHQFIKKGRGHVVVTSSTAGKLGAPYSATYTGSKHALHGYFECLRSELHSFGIDVTLICPGPVYSNLVADAFTETASKVYGIKPSPEERKMSTSRCSYLMGIAIANKLDEAWISLQPILLMYYLAQYTPTVFRMFIMKALFTNERATAFRDSRG